MGRLAQGLGWLKAAPGKTWQGLKNFKNWKFWGGAGAGGAGGGLLANSLNQMNQPGQQQDAEQEQSLDVETLDQTPNITPVQQLNMTTTGVVSPMQIGGTPEEKLDYIANSVDSMRRSVSTLVGMVRSLAMGQSALNRNVGVVATQQTSKPSFFGQSLRQGLIQGGLGALAALGIGAIAGGLAGVSHLTQENKKTLADIKPAIDDIKSGKEAPEKSKLYNAAEMVVGYWNNGGVNLGDTTSIETAMESDPAITALVNGLRDNGIEVDTKATVNSLLETVKNIKPSETQQGATPEAAPQTTVPTDGQQQQPTVENNEQPLPAETIPPPSSNEGAVLENSTAAPSLAAPPAAAAPNTDANIEQPLEGETEEDEMGIAPQSSIGDQLQTEPENQLLSSTKFIRDRSQEAATSNRAVVAPVVMNNSQAPTQQQMPHMAEGRLRGATLTVAYRTPADSRTYSQDNFASV